MINSLLYIFKRPDLIAKGEPFLEGVLRRFQAREHYTPNLAQEINLAAFQRLRAICLKDHPVHRIRSRYGVGAYLLTLHTRRIVLMDEVRTAGLHATDWLRTAWKYQIALFGLGVLLL